MLFSKTWIAPVKRKLPMPFLRLLNLGYHICHDAGLFFELDFAKKMRESIIQVVQSL